MNKSLDKSQRFLEFWQLETLRVSMRSTNAFNSRLPHDVRLRRAPQRTVSSQSNCGRCGRGSEGTIPFLAPLLPAALLVALIIVLDDSAQLSEAQYAEWPTRLFATLSIGLIVVVTGCGYALVFATVACSQRTHLPRRCIERLHGTELQLRTAQLAAWRESVTEQARGRGREFAEGVLMVPSEREAHVWARSWDSKRAWCKIAPLRVYWSVLQLPAVGFLAMLLVAHAPDLWLWCNDHNRSTATCVVAYFPAVLGDGGVGAAGRLGSGAGIDLPSLLLLRVGAMVLGIIFSAASSIASCCTGCLGVEISPSRQWWAHAVVSRIHAYLWVGGYVLLLLWDLWFNLASWITMDLSCDGSGLIGFPNSTYANGGETGFPTASTRYPTGYPTTSNSGPSSSVPTTRFPTVYPTIPPTSISSRSSLPADHFAYNSLRSCRFYSWMTQVLIYAVAIFHFIRWFRFFLSFPAVLTSDTLTRPHSSRFRRLAMLQCLYERFLCCPPFEVANRMRGDWDRWHSSAAAAVVPDEEDATRPLPRAITEFVSGTGMLRLLLKWRSRRPFEALALGLVLRLESMLLRNTTARVTPIGAAGGDRAGAVNEWTGLGLEMQQLGRRQRSRDAAAASAVVYRASTEEEALQTQVDELLCRARSANVALEDAAIPTASNAQLPQSAEAGSELEDDAAIGEAVANGERLGGSTETTTTTTTSTTSGAFTMIPSQFLCPITHEVMSSPVVLAGDGYSYERSAIAYWLGAGHYSSPMSNVALDVAGCQLVENRTLASAIALWRDALVTHSKE